MICYVTVVILAKLMLKIGEVYLSETELKVRRNHYKLWFAFLATDYSILAVLGL